MEKDVITMRLFISVNFNETVKRLICACIDCLKDCSARGNFTRSENLHLTLVFIGETSKVSEVKKAMEMVTAPPFELSLGGIGCFKRNGGNVFWLGVRKSSSLFFLQRQLCSSLQKAGFSPEDREFRPHLTLGREVFLSDGFNRDDFEKRIPPMNLTVSGISLMKSERIRGLLTYTELFSKPLSGSSPSV